MHCWPAPHALHVDPPLPHAAPLVPPWHTPFAQQPDGHVAGLHAGVVVTHC